MAMRDIARYYGVNHVGKGIVKLANYADELFGVGKPIYLKPSFWTVIGISGVLPILANRLGWSWSTKEVVYLLGGYVSTKVWDWIEEVIAGFFKVKTTVSPGIIAPSIPPSPASAPAPQAGTTMLRK